MIFRMEVKASANEKIETLPSDCVYDARRLALCATENVRKIDIICKNIQVTHVLSLTIGIFPYMHSCGQYYEFKVLHSTEVTKFSMSHRSLKPYCLDAYS